MKVFFIVAIGMCLFPMGLKADDLSDLKVEMQSLRQLVQQQQQEIQGLREEAKTRETEFNSTVVDLQQKFEVLTVKKEFVDASKTDVMAKEPSEAKKSFLKDFLHKAKINLPEKGAQLATTKDKLKRETPSGNYADQSSFFFLHGYSTVTYADLDKEQGSAPGETSQILISGTSTRSGKHESGFKNDTALFIGSELTQNLSGSFEVHFVGNARDPVITESKIMWAPVEVKDEAPSLRFVGGRYWWPFGIHNEEWFSALNNFNLLSPVAAEVVPAHVNEVGVMAEGEWDIAENFGINYLFSVGNGPTSFEMSDNVGASRSNSLDHDSNRMFTTRLGVFPWIENLNFGFSFAKGALRRNTDTSFATTDARRYDADLTAYGVDTSYVYKKLDLRAYWYFSKEDLDGGASLESLDRNGGTIDVLYTLTKDAPLFKEVILKLRASSATDVTLSDGTFRRSQYGFGVNARPHEHFLLKAEYFIQKEEDITELDNDGFTLSGTVEF